MEKRPYFLCWRWSWQVCVQKNRPTDSLDSLDFSNDSLDVSFCKKRRPMIRWIFSWIQWFVWVFFCKKIVKWIHWIHCMISNDSLDVSFCQKRRPKIAKNRMNPTIHLTSPLFGNGLHRSLLKRHRSLLIHSGEDLERFIRKETLIHWKGDFDPLEKKPWFSRKEIGRKEIL